MIQSQFDAASKLGAPTTELCGAASDERPRKRRKTTPPMQDSIEVAPENSPDPASPSEGDTVATGESVVAAPLESSVNAASTSNDGAPSPRSESEAERRNNSHESAYAMDDEVVLLSEEAILAEEQLILGEVAAIGEDSAAKEDVPDPPGDISGESSKILDGKQQTAQTTPQPPMDVLPPKQFSRQGTPASQILASAPGPLERCQAQQPITAQSSRPSTPKSASNSGPQTTSSSPLSSPPPGELFDSLDDQLTEPPPSSSRPSSPVSIKNGDIVEGDNIEGDDTEPLWSQDYMNRSSTFRRSLSTLKGKELFDASIWSDPLKTSVFYTFATNLRQKSRDADPTGCHQFISHLSKAGKMVRCYTQNIDLLEDKVGLSTHLLLGAGNRSRFSTRASRAVGTVATNVGTTGPLDPSNNNNQPTLIPSGSGPLSPSQPDTVDAPAASQGTGKAGSQGAPLRPLEVNIGHHQASSADTELVEGSGDQGGERGGRCEQDETKTDAQPVDAGSSSLDTSLPETTCAIPTSPGHDRGVECVFLHGSLRALRCFQCGCVADWEGARELQTMSGQQPPCPRCEDATNARQEQGKRALGVGKLRPDIVLYGEEHPESQQIASIIQHDISLAPDMLIIMGTSLKVHGLKTVVKEFAKTVHNRKDGKVIFINYTKPAESVWADVIDFWVEMDCDSWVQDLKEKKPIIWMPPGSVEDEPRITNSKRRRPPADDVNRKEAKKPKKIEDIPKMATVTATVRDNGKKAKQTKKVELPTNTDPKPHVPKRPAAHRDCKQNAAYWTTKIVGDLAKMTGRLVTPGPPPYRIPPATQNATQNPALDKVTATTRAAVPAKARSGPRTKNTISRKAREAAATTKSSQGNRIVKRVKSQGARARNTISKRRTKGSEPAAISKTSSATYAKDVFSLRQESETKLDINVLAEVPVPNSGPDPGGDDIPMVSVVKNRIRKPKVFFGESGPPSSAPAPRRTTAPGEDAKSSARAASQPKKANLGQSQQTLKPGEVKIELRFLPPVLYPRPEPQSAVAQCAPIRLEPLLPINQEAIKARRDSFFQVALGSPGSGPPPVEYLEPVFSPGPNNMSPQLSPKHWQRRSYSYTNAVFRAPLEFTGLWSGGSGGSGVPGYTHQPAAAPQHKMALGDAPQLTLGPSIVPNMSASSHMPGDSPNLQLQRETEAAAALSQMAMATYSQRQFDHI